jgi:hypothetical protein
MLRLRAVAVLLGLNMVNLQTQSTGVEIMINGKIIASRAAINFPPTNGIVMSCADNPALNRVDCSPNYSTAVMATLNQVTGGPLTLISTNGTAAYTANVSAGAYKSTPSKGDTFLLYVDTECVAGCSLNINNGSQSYAIKQLDGTTDPGQNLTTTLMVHAPRWIFFNGAVWLLLP